MRLNNYVGGPALLAGLPPERAGMEALSGAARVCEVADALREESPQTLVALLERNAGRTPHAPALLAPGRAPLSHAALLEQVQETSAALQGLAIGHGDTVALALPSGPEMACAFLAVAAAARTAPLNPAYRQQEFAAYLSDLGARALIVAAGDSTEARAAAATTGVRVLELVPRSHEGAGRFDLRGLHGLGRAAAATPCDVALLLHTSGTTARPKLVPLTHANLCNSSRNIGRSLQLSPADRSLVVMPLFHSHGLLGGLLAVLAAGGSAACVPHFDASRFFDWVRELRPTYITAAPTLFQAVLEWAEQHPGVADGHSSLRLLRTASSALPPPVCQRLEQLLQVPVIETYGLTETATQVTSNPLPPGVRKPGSAGKAAGAEVRVIDEAGTSLPVGGVGEVVVRGPGVTAGYLDDAAANAAAFRDGWLRTGDQGYLDADGYLFLTGRIKENINRAGEKISPREVEEVLLQHPAVAEAAVFGVPHELLGESVAAAVVAHQGQDAVATEAELRRFVGQHLADFKVPARILLVPAIPKSATGKVQRLLLREQLPAARAAMLTGSSLEDRLEAIWRQVLGVSAVGRQDDFFEAGGDSVLAVSLLVQIERELGFRLFPESLYEANTIDSLAAFLRRQRAGAAPGATALAAVPARAGDGRPPQFLVPPAGENPLVFRELIAALDPAQPIYCLPGLHAKVRTSEQQDVETAVAGYVQAVRDAQPQGPYQVCGFSFGGTLAVELARQLCQAGGEVACVALIDSRCPGYARPTSFVQKVQKHWRALGRLRGRKKLSYLGDRVRELLPWPFASTPLPPSAACSRSVSSASVPVDPRAIVYRPKPYPGTLTLYRALEQEIVHHAQRTMGWEYVAQEVRVFDVPGGHFTVIKEPLVRSLAAALAAHLAPGPGR